MVKPGPKASEQTVQEEVYGKAINTLQTRRRLFSWQAYDLIELDQLFL